VGRRRRGGGWGDEQRLINQPENGSFSELDTRPSRALRDKTCSRGREGGNKKSCCEGTQDDNNAGREDEEGKARVIVREGLGCVEGGRGENKQEIKLGQNFSL
jgi:hypothetical protein